MLDDLEFRQQRIAVIACRVHRIASVGELRPERVGEEFVLRHRRPIAVALGVMLVGAVDLLQEHHVGRHAAHGFTQFRQDETPIERGEALVRVHGQYRETMHRGEGCRSLFGGAQRQGFIHESTPSATGSPGVVSRFSSRPNRSSKWRAS
ncbi:hypothetical protein D3C73_1177120 [compost metagenome]